MSKFSKVESFCDLLGWCGVSGDINNKNSLSYSISDETTVKLFNFLSDFGFGLKANIGLQTTLNVLTNSTNQTKPTNSKSSFELFK